VSIFPSDAAARAVSIIGFAGGGFNSMTLIGKYGDIPGAICCSASIQEEMRNLTLPITDK
jgi:hypothetical protein